MKSETLKFVFLTSFIFAGLIGGQLFADEGGGGAEVKKEGKDGGEKQEVKKDGGEKKIAIKAEALSAKGTLSNKEGKYSIETAEKAVIRIQANEKTTIKPEDLEKLVGKVVEIKGIGFTPEGGTPKFSKIESVTEVAAAQ
jgi:hypothetical protein